MSRRATPKLRDAFGHRQRDDEPFREHVTRTGTRYYTFYFGDGTQTIYVVSYEKPQCQAGAATVEGTFEQVKWRVKVNYSYEKIATRNVTCVRGDGQKIE